VESDALTFRAKPICARRSAPETSLCGPPGLTTLWTNQRRYVDCPSCLAEIERRLAEPTRRGPVAPAVAAGVA
jgi:hypothetical protein